MTRFDPTRSTRDPARGLQVGFILSCVTLGLARGLWISSFIQHIVAFTFHSILSFLHCFSRFIISFILLYINSFFHRVHYIFILVIPLLVPKHVHICMYFFSLSLVRNTRDSIAVFSPSNYFFPLFYYFFSRIFPIKL